ncbi:hypothetical protein MO973_19380 [Paenibacillus sp. TRM 82003]|nr:hypothetical protein [Paenibacillus sp. TRM 82003]
MSFRELQTVSGELLERRIVEVKPLASMKTEQYSVVKDEETGEHYLHYRYIHRDVAAGGAEAAYHQLMPLETDDVLGVMFGEQPYRYPDDWTRRYLRNGPDGDYVWFDPSPALDDGEGEREAARIREALLKFKKEGSFDAADVAKLLRELDEGSNREE